jgi:hypothetical protein
MVRVGLGEVREMPVLGCMFVSLLREAKVANRVRVPVWTSARSDGHRRHRSQLEQVSEG